MNAFLDGSMAVNLSGAFDNMGRSDRSNERRLHDILLFFGVEHAGIFSFDFLRNVYTPWAVIAGFSVNENHEKDADHVILLRWVFILLRSQLMSKKSVVYKF